MSESTSPSSGENSIGPSTGDVKAEVLVGGQAKPSPESGNTFTQGVIAMALNFSCSVCIIPFNKHLFTVLGFKFVLFLSCAHMIITLATTYGLLWRGYIKYKKLPWNDFIVVGTLNALGLACLNLSLSTNSIGVYQLAKMLSVPAVTLVSWAFYGKVYSRQTLTALALMTVGICLAVGQRVDLTMTGVLFASGGIAFAAFAVVKVGELQGKHNCGSSLVVWYMMHPQLIACIVVALVFEPLMPWQAQSIWEYEWSSSVVILIGATCCLASLLNITGVWVVGAFSALTFAAVGYAKTATVLSTGILVFGDEMSVGISIGLALVFAGLILYQRSK